MTTYPHLLAKINLGEAVDRLKWAADNLALVPELSPLLSLVTTSLESAQAAYEQIKTYPINPNQI